MAKHTRGPWRARRHNDDPQYRWAHVLGGDGLIVATFTSAPARARGDDEVGANAHLIEAAPDLLAALRRIIGDVTPYGTIVGRPDLIQDARAAIAKAEGRAPDSG